MSAQLDELHFLLLCHRSASFGLVLKFDRSVWGIQIFVHGILIAIAQCTRNMSFQPTATVAVIGLVSVNHSARVKAGDASKIDNETLLSTDMCSLVSLQSGTLKTRLMRKLNTHWFLVDQWGFGSGGPQIRTPSSRSPIPVSLANCSHLQKSKLFSDWLGQTDKLYAFLSHLFGDKTLTSNAHPQIRWPFSELS